MNMENGNLIGEMVKATMETDKKVGFGLLMNLQCEAPDYQIDEIIAYLEMNEVPLTDNVRKLGVICGILCE